MLIALTGLHGAGKSYFANNILAKYGFKIYRKKELLPFICKETTNRDDWIKWYREEFKKDPEKITSLMLSYIDTNDNVVIDAVHSPLEWNILSSKIKDSALVGIITPESIRKQRREIDDAEKDKKRIEHWHNVKNECLMTKVDWVFNGGASLEINEELFNEFMEYMKERENILSGKDISFTHNKIERLSALIKENYILENKLKQAENLIANYKKNNEQEKENER